MVLYRDFCLYKQNANISKRTKKISLVASGEKDGSAKEENLLSLDIL